jgi:hypothetical protein
MIEKSTLNAVAGQFYVTHKKIEGLVPLYLLEEKSLHPKFAAYYLNTHQYILIKTGEIDLYDFNGRDNEKKEFFSYGDTNKKLPYIFVAKLSGGGDYPYGFKGVGTALMQLAIEYSLIRGYGGKIQLDAIEDSAMFYYHKIHMRVLGRFRELTENKLNNLEKEDIECEMYLPEAAIPIWQQKINEKPILNEYQLYLSSHPLNS